MTDVRNLTSVMLPDSVIKESLITAADGKYYQTEHRAQLVGISEEFVPTFGYGEKPLDFRFEYDYKSKKKRRTGCGVRPPHLVIQSGSGMTKITCIIGDYHAEHNVR